MNTYTIITLCLNDAVPFFYCIRQQWNFRCFESFEKIIRSREREKGGAMCVQQFCFNFLLLKKINKNSRFSLTACNNERATAKGGIFSLLLLYFCCCFFFKCESCVKSLWFENEFDDWYIALKVNCSNFFSFYFCSQPADKWNTSACAAACEIHQDSYLLHLCLSFGN